MDQFKLQSMSPFEIQKLQGYNLKEADLEEIMEMANAKHFLPRSISILCYEHQKLTKKVKELEEKLEIANEALNKIASWSEGKEVTGSFDEQRR